jgi:hypothetical protein
MSQTVFTDGLGYEGKVTLTLKSNNQVLKSKTYKNKGTAQLFKFLGYCLIGAYEEAKNFLPNKILLLYNMEQNPMNASATAVTPSSAWQTLAQTPTITSDSTNSQVSVMYSFEVSRAAISARFNQVALYGVGIDAEDITDFSAYYFLVDGHNEWDVIDPELWSTTTVLLIEWELTISNKNIETNTGGGDQT